MYFPRDRNLTRNTRLDETNVLFFFLGGGKIIAARGSKTLYPFDAAVTQALNIYIKGIVFARFVH